MLRAACLAVMNGMMHRMMMDNGVMMHEAMMHGMMMHRSVMRRLMPGFVMTRRHGKTGHSDKY